MEILTCHKGWIHTYFLTDCIRLSVAQSREIAAALQPVLHQHYIVYGIRFTESRHDPGITIVLECIPLRQALEQIEQALRRIVAPIPARPTPVRAIVGAPTTATVETTPADSSANASRMAGT
jgi:hypothetical protein